MRHHEREAPDDRFPDAEDFEPDGLWSEIWWTVGLFTTVTALLAAVGWLGGSVSA